MTTRILDSADESYGSYYDVKKIYEKKTNFQHIEIVENNFFGKMLILDGNVQTTERDEFMYHEFLCHVPLITHPNPKKVLIIGGGDGGLLKEILKYDYIFPTLVEIDEEVINSVSKYIPTIPMKSFENSRCKIIIDDGIKFIKNTDENYDVILIDSTDPEGPSLGLFTEENYQKMKKILGENGILAVQSGSPIYQKEMLDLVRKNMKMNFNNVNTYLGNVLSYPGVIWSFTLCSQNYEPLLLDEKIIKKRFENISTIGFNPLQYKNLFFLPKYLNIK